jgi:Right handed beta helix region
VGHGISGAVSGRGSPLLTVRHCLIRRWRLGINLPNVGDRGWVIRDNVIETTTDSGILIEDGTVLNGRGASGTLIEGNTIRDTGLGRFDFGLHGIYTRGPRTTIRGNRILRFRDSGISFRFQDTTIENNIISGGREGITWFPYASRAGTARIAYNRVHGATEAALFIDGAQRQIEAPQETRESFVVVNNTFLTAATASGVTVKAGMSPRFVFANNIVAGPRNILFRVDHRPRAYVEENNLWYAGGREKWLYVGRAFSSLDQLRSASRQGTRDVVADPRLGETLMPTADSPALDAGGTFGGPYRPTCIGLPFSYCGRAPDIGAVERRAPARSR